MKPVSCNRFQKPTRAVKVLFVGSEEGSGLVVPWLAGSRTSAIRCRRDGRLVLAANVACWGAVVVVWIAAAVREAGTPAGRRVHGSPDPGWSCSPWPRSPRSSRRALDPLAVHGGCTLGPADRRRRPCRIHAFAIWARLALGRAWSVDPQAAADRGLRTDGPYAIDPPPDLYRPAWDAAGQRAPWRAGTGDRARSRWTGHRLAQDPVRGATPARDVSRRIRGLPRTGAGDPGLALAGCPVGRNEVRRPVRSQGQIITARVRVG